MHAKHPKLVGAAGGRPGSSHRVGPTSAAFWVVLALLVTPLSSSAESWCAYPIWAHEWGVQVFGEAPNAPEKLSSAHTPTDATEASTTPSVRNLPIDGGERDLPVLAFYAPTGWSDPIPLGLEVGFSAGAASRWYPQVDTRVDAVTANSDDAKAKREALLAARAARRPFGTTNDPLGADPTRQLLWEHLNLSAKGAASALTSQSWVEAQRQLDGALWVSRGAESERFAFYEGKTDERPLVQVERGEGWTEQQPRYLLKNQSEWPVHDVLVVRRHGTEAWVFYAPSLDPSGEAKFSFDEAMDAGSDAFRKATRGRLSDTLVDAETPTPPKEYRWGGSECVEGRDPAKPVETASGHQLYQAEVDLLLDTWGPALFEHEGTVVIYREDVATLDALMPLSLYTDMFHFIDLRRTGLVLWTDATW